MDTRYSTYHVLHKDALGIGLGTGAVANVRPSKRPSYTTENLMNGEMGNR